MDKRSSTHILYAIIGLVWAVFTTAAAQTVDCKPGCILISVQRIRPSAPPANASLAAPSFESLISLVPYGSALKIIAPPMPAGAVLEYSTDNGISWTAGNQVIILNREDIVARVRLGQQTSPLLKGSFKPYYQRLLVIGNSIMFHGPAPDLGWTNSNGMAASAPEKDFVHLFAARLQTLNPATTFRLQAGTGLELDFGKATYKMDEFDEPMQSFQPDLVVIRLGENISDGDVPVRQFESQFRQFIERLVSLSQGRAVKIITTTSVWDKPMADAVIRKVIAEKAFPLVDLSSMVGQSQYFASQYADPGVAKHPNDAGMQKITDLIWAVFP